MYPGLVALPLGRFSVRGVRHIMLIGRLSLLIPRVAEITDAAPPQSPLM